MNKIYVSNVGVVGPRTPFGAWLDTVPPFDQMTLGSSPVSGSTLYMLDTFVFLVSAGNSQPGHTLAKGFQTLGRASFAYLPKPC